MPLTLPHPIPLPHTIPSDSSYAIQRSPRIKEGFIEKTKTDKERLPPREALTALAKIEKFKNYYQLACELPGFDDWKALDDTQLNQWNSAFGHQMALAELMQPLIVLEAKGFDLGKISREFNYWNTSYAHTMFRLAVVNVTILGIQRLAGVNQDLTFDAEKLSSNHAERLVEFTKKLAHTLKLLQQSNRFETKSDRDFFTDLGLYYGELYELEQRLQSLYNHLSHRTPSSSTAN